ncbi:hypothetical protein T439DRAFT_324738 [Meredithblackwellia eburnea MCA 4105]
MAPDRTAASFSAAQALNLPLSSHGKNHAPSIQRGKACLTCRNRKVKCDGVKPTCGACARSAVAHGDEPNAVVCNFDEEERGEKRKRGGGASKVALLEEKIAQLERIIEQQQSSLQPSPTSTFEVPQPISAPSYSPPAFSYSQVSSSFPSPSSRNSLDALLQATSSSSTSGQPFPGFTQDIPNTCGPGSSTSGIFFAEPSNPSAAYPDHDTTSAAASLQALLNPMPAPTRDPLLEIFYPGWPNDLPSPHLVSRLVDVYFAKTHAATGMVNQGRFLANLALPPTHSGFPHTSLIHAMLATAARMVGNGFFSNEERYWGTADDTSAVADYHGLRAKFHIDAALARGQKLFHVAQAVVLVCHWSFTTSRFVEVWLYTGLATRIATPMGLNHLRATLDDADSNIDRPPHMKANLLPPIKDEEELFERSATFWLAIVCDRFASASTGWAIGLDDKDITSLLPSSGPNYTNGDLASSPLSTHNASFLMSHPPHLVQCFQLYIKAIVLLGRVVGFMQRCPTPIGMGANHPDPRRNPNTPGVSVDLRTTADFKRLDADAVTFRLSIPREFSGTAAHTNADVRMVLVFIVPHVATILLHEPFCTMQDADVSLARCLMSARAILESLYSLWGTSFDVSLLPPFFCFCSAVCGRTLVREMAIKEAKSESDGIAQLKTDVQAIQSIVRSHRSPLGESVAQSLQTLLDSPEKCLPTVDLKHAGLGLPMQTGYCPGSQPGEPAPATYSSSSSSSDQSRFTPATSIHSTSSAELSPASMQSAPGSGILGNIPSPAGIVELDYTTLFAQTSQTQLQQEGFSPADSDRFRDLLSMGVEGLAGWPSPGPI